MFFVCTCKVEFIGNYSWLQIGNAFCGLWSEWITLFLSFTLCCNVKDLVRDGSVYKCIYIGSSYWLLMLWSLEYVFVCSCIFCTCHIFLLTNPFVIQQPLLVHIGFPCSLLKLPYYQKEHYLEKWSKYILLGTKVKEWLKNVCTAKLCPKGLITILIDFFFPRFCSFY